MHEDRKQNLSEFVAYVRNHLTGDEKGEAQIFLDRLFQAFELKGVREAGATLEMRVKKRDEVVTAPALETSAGRVCCARIGSQRPTPSGVTGCQPQRSMPINHICG